MRGDPDERIVAAAIRITFNDADHIFTLAAPARHYHVRRFAAGALGLKQLPDHDDGFITSEGRFVRRRAAGRIAFLAGQTGEVRREQLNTEHLW